MQSALMGQRAQDDKHRVLPQQRTGGGETGAVPMYLPTLQTEGRCTARRSPACPLAPAGPPCRAPARHTSRITPGWLGHVGSDRRTVVSAGRARAKNSASRRSPPVPAGASASACRVRSGTRCLAGDRDPRAGICVVPAAYHWGRGTGSPRGAGGAEAGGGCADLRWTGSRPRGPRRLRGCRPPAGAQRSSGGSPAPHRGVGTPAGGWR